MAASSTTKPLKPVWRAFDRVIKDGKIHGACKYCSKDYVSHCDRILKHILSCSKAPLAIKESLAKDSNLKEKGLCEPDVSDPESVSDMTESSDKVNIYSFHINH